MQKVLNRYIVLFKRWAWLIILGVVICGTATYIISKLMPPVYEASATLVINLKSSTSATDNLTASELAVPTYAQLLTNSAVLEPVVAQHQGMTVTQLSAMISVKTPSNTQLIELDVKNSNPLLAMQLANEISQSFAQFVQSKFPANVQLVPARLPTDPTGQKPSMQAVFGALVGLGFALALIVIFEWIADLPTSLEEVQDLLGMEVLAAVPRLSRNQRQRGKELEQTPALVEGLQLLHTRLNAIQATRLFKLVMITSALEAEGKSTVAVNLASLLARTGKSVLLVDANLRRPALDQYFSIDNQYGLLSMLRDMGTPLKEELCGQATNTPALRVLIAGPVQSNPVELLQSQHMEKLIELFEQASFDYVIFDTPPLLPIADAQILATHIQALVLVVDVSRTSRRILQRVRRVLDQTPVMILGATINKSIWSDYGDIRQYLGFIRKPKTDISMVIQPSIEEGG